MLKSIKEHIGSPISRTALHNIRTVPDHDVRIYGETFVYDQIYAQIFLKDKVISGFEIESELVAAMQRGIFETLWEGAQPAAKLIENLHL